MARKYNRLNALIYPYLGIVAPWQDKIGAPGFPKKYLWESSGFEPAKVNSEWIDSTGSLTVTGTYKATTAEIKITILSSTQGKVEYKKNGVIEGVITETLADNPKRVILNFHSDQNPKADLNITVQQQNDNAFITLKFAGKTFSGDYQFGQETIPSYLLALLDEIEAYNPNIKIAALNHGMAVPVYGVAYDVLGEVCATRGPSWWEIAASLTAAALADYISNGAGTAGVACTNPYILLLPKE